MMKNNTTYTIIFNIRENSIPNYRGVTVSGVNDCYYGGGSYRLYHNSGFTLDKGVKKIVVTTGDNVNEYTGFGFGFPAIEMNSIDAGLKFVIGNTMVLEGDHTNTPIEELPFGEGIYSVAEAEATEDGKYLISGKSCGKNLINHNKWTKSIETTVIDNNDGSFTLTTTSPWKGLLFKDIILKPNTNYTVNCKTSDTNIGIYVRLRQQDGGYNSQATWGGKFPVKFRTGNKVSIVQVSIETITALNDVIISDIQLEETSTPTPYEPYQESTYSYILDKPLMQLPNGVADSINLETGVLTRRVGEITLNGTESDYSIYGGGGSQETETTTAFKYRYYEHRSTWANKKNAIVDTMPVVGDLLYGRSDCGYASDDDFLIFRIAKSNLETQDADGFKKWLQANPTTICYELKNPTTEQLTPTQLKSFEGATHIVSNNTLQAHTSVKIPSNVNLVVQTLRAENKALNVELNDTKIELENTDLDILEMNWETDFRVCELEYAIYGQVAKTTELENNIRAISKYEQAKTLILADRYNKATMTKQLEVYFDRGYISEKEYQELIELMN